MIVQSSQSQSQSQLQASQSQPPQSHDPGSLSLTLVSRCTKSSGLVIVGGRHASTMSTRVTSTPSSLPPFLLLSDWTADLGCVVKGSSPIWCSNVELGLTNEISTSWFLLLLYSTEPSVLKHNIIARCQSSTVFVNQVCSPSYKTPMKCWLYTTIELQTQF